MLKVSAVMKEPSIISKISVTLRAGPLAAIRGLRRLRRAAGGFN
ncbi:hypothetical protein ACWA2B_04445 [Paenibacillus sp. CMM36]